MLRLCSNNRELFCFQTQSASSTTYATTRSVGGEAEMNVGVEGYGVVVGPGGVAVVGKMSTVAVGTTGVMVAGIC